jgi:hypothetical protein
MNPAWFRSGIGVAFSSWLEEISMKSAVLLTAIILLPLSAFATPDLSDNYFGLNEQEFAQQLQSLPAKSKGVLLAKNLGVTIASCPTSHAYQILMASMETFPLITPFMARMINVLAGGATGHRDDLADFDAKHGLFAYMFGGPANGIFEALAQTFNQHVTDPADPSLEIHYDTKQIKQSFKDGYFATINAQTDYNGACYRAERRIQMIVASHKKAQPQLEPRNPVDEGNAGR